MEDNAQLDNTAAYIKHKFEYIIYNVSLKLIVNKKEKKTKAEFLHKKLF